MLQWIILLLLVGSQALADNGTIYYSLDGADWTPITTQNISNQSGALYFLQENTNYYIRCENETTNYTLTQRTKPAGEPAMASEGILWFMIIMTASLFMLPKLVGRFSKHCILDLLIKRCCLIGGLLMLLLTITIAATISNTFGIGVKGEMFTLLSIAGYAIYLAVFFVVLAFGKDAIDMWGKAKQKRQRGYDGEDNHDED